MKKTICLVTNWYPTKENPDQGQFFKEQAFVLAEHYDFVVIHYQEKCNTKLFQRGIVKKINLERNTVEYEIEARTPLFLFIFDTMYNLYRIISKRGMVEGVGKYVSNWRKEFTKSRMIKAFRKGIKEQIDLFYCVDAQKEAFLLEVLAEEYKKPYIIGEHAPVPWPGTVLSDINKNAIEKADVFLAISNDKIRQMMLLNIKLPPIIYIGNMVDETKLEIKRENHEVKTFITVAANSYYKNYDMFISVFNRLKDITAQPFRIMIVGYASNKGYSRNIEEFEKTIRKTKFAGLVEMIPRIPHDKIGELFNKADAFVMTSIQEGQPVSAMEAACCGLPVFSTRCGGVEDYIDELAGRIYNISDTEGMAKGLNSFLNNELVFDSEYIREKTIQLFGKEAFITNFRKAISYKGQE